MYAIVKTGGKQYRVQEGQSLVVERLPVDDGAKVSLDPLLYVDGATVLDGDELGKVKVEAKVLAHERGPKLRIVKFKPKRGYRRRTGHRQELTRLEVTGIKLATRRRAAAGADAEPSGEPPAAEQAEAAGAPRAARGRGRGAEPAGRGRAAAAPEKPAPKSRARKPAGGEKAPAAKPAAEKSRAPARKRPSRAKPKEGDDGS
ncbi:MAG: 50S ribosomal protein L21 [Solirubrobacterales bacterium]|nr:50S ribosomal protein L21 [Solirubrobacterales bacterium]MBV9836760.1 50S ribosomal protein L21 [Solirubrobacterales bacterium]